MLWARVVRGAASRAKLVKPALAMRCRPSASKGLSMPTRVAPAWTCDNSAGVGGRTLSTKGQAQAWAASVISAPAATKASSVALAANPAPDWMRRVWPKALSFFTVSGVAATRVSPGRVSAGTPISMKFSSG